ncbi:hypothetical protein Pta6605_50720 [Pseudomonas amygdali pv. tabaci]|nr:hypothetical protein Pta6605_50720 [Pseudomonas amygdali pv. tabaci]
MTFGSHGHLRKIMWAVYPNRPQAAGACVDRPANITAADRLQSPETWDQPGGQFI